MGILKKKVNSPDDVRDVARRKGVKGLAKLVRTSSDPWIAGLAANELAGYGRPGAQALATLLVDDDREVRHNAAHQFAQQWRLVLDVGYEPLISALFDEYWEVRNAAVSALSVAGRGPERDDNVTQALLAALQDDNGNVRFGAAEYFRHVPDPRAVEPLISVLTRSKRYGDDRIAAAKSLREIRGERATEVLSRVAEDPSDDDLVKKACTES